MTLQLNFLIYEENLIFFLSVYSPLFAVHNSTDPIILSRGSDSLAAISSCDPLGLYLRVLISQGVYECFASGILANGGHILACNYSLKICYKIYFFFRLQVPDGTPWIHRRLSERRLSKWRPSERRLSERRLSKWRPSERWLSKWRLSERRVFRWRGLGPCTGLHRPLAGLQWPLAGLQSFPHQREFGHHQVHWPGFCQSKAVSHGLFSLI
jgi:hypothetical protein